MSITENIPDSTDWLSTPLAALAPLESSLRCQVCKDFFTTPMITSCSHTFCSLCIRRCLSQEGKCPACREPDQEVRLRRNWVVEELVVQFTQSRQSILEAALSISMVNGNGDGEGRPKKKRKVQHDGTNGVEKRNTRSHSRMVASQSSTDFVITHDRSEISDSDEGNVYTDHQNQNYSHNEPNDGLISCPCCGRRMKEVSINTHLDKCIAGVAEEEAPSTPTARRPPAVQVSAGSIAYSQPKASIQHDRLPTINYAILNETTLRKKLKDLGIPTAGTREHMRKRHTEWINLWNSNCDSQRPRSKRDLLHELDRWEKTLGRQMDRGPTGVMVKDFDRCGWQKSNKNDFDDLIAKARQRRTVAGKGVTDDSSSVSSEPTTAVPASVTLADGESELEALSNGVDTVSAVPDRKLDEDGSVHSTVGTTLSQ